MSAGKQSFEEAMKKLEAIVAELEKGDHTLEESLRKFEEGLELGKSCREMLDRAEARVKLLVEGAGDSLEEKDAPDEF